TQPVPNPMLYYMHQSPWWFHRFEVLSNYFIGLIVLLFTFLERLMCMVNGTLQIVFQVTLIVICFDDRSLGFLFSSGQGAKQAVLHLQAEEAERTEVILQGTLSEDQKDPDAVWEDYQFLCKPGDLTRLPCLIFPYHYRLDWLMWVRGEHFKYKFSPPGSAGAARGKWWVRKRIGAFFPAVDLAALRGYFKSQNWLHPDL
ncbi:unnamed protein product, partial [Coregonus sp. 'balchen']